MGRRGLEERRPGELNCTCSLCLHLSVTGDIDRLILEQLPALPWNTDSFWTVLSRYLFFWSQYLTFGDGKSWKLLVSALSASQSRVISSYKMPKEPCTKPILSVFSQVAIWGEGCVAMEAGVHFRGINWWT